MTTVHGLLPALSGNEHIWLFQSNPEYFSIVGALNQMTMGDVSTWNVREHRGELRGGDLVLFWQSGQAAGLYAIGTLVGEPFLGEAVEEGKDQEWWMKWRLNASIDPPLAQSELQRHPVLTDMQIIQTPSQTNYPVTPGEWHALRELLEAEPGFEPVVGDV